MFRGGRQRDMELRSPERQAYKYGNDFEFSKRGKTGKEKERKITEKAYGTGDHIRFGGPHRKKVGTPVLSKRIRGKQGSIRARGGERKLLVESLKKKESQVGCWGKNRQNWGKLLWNA